MAKATWQPNPKGWPSGKNWCKRWVGTEERTARARTRPSVGMHLEACESALGDDETYREVDMIKLRWAAAEHVPLLREIIAFLDVDLEAG